MPDRDEGAEVKECDEKAREVKIAGADSRDSREESADGGKACIKPQYIDHGHVRRLAEEYLPKDIIDEIKDITECDAAKGGNQAAGENAEPPVKKLKLKGRYKSRRNEKKPDDSDKICHSILNGLECRFGDSCKFLHDIQQYLSNKLQDIGDSCYLFSTYGRCPYGLACRYGSSHIKDGKNVVNEKLHANFVNKKLTCNTLDKSIQIALRKKKYNFQKANEVHSEIARTLRVKKESPSMEDGFGEEMVSPDKSMASSNDPCDENSVIKDTEQLDLGTQCSSDTKVKTSDQESTEGCSIQNKQTCDTIQGKDVKGSEPPVNSDNSQDCRVKVEKSPSSGLDQEGIRLRSVEKKKIDFRDKLYLAPLTTVGNLPFRRVCKEYGVDITCGEMAMSTNLLQGKNSEWALLRRHHTEDLFGVQLCGSFPDSMARCGQLIVEQAEVDFIDINCGCPIDLVYKKGGGCALMSRANKFEQIVRGMTGVLDVPLTIKMRTGIFEDKSTAHHIVPKLRDWGAAMCTIHGRSREQRYTKLADWDYITQCAQAGQPMPIYGNGDILSYVEANSFRETTGVSGLMVARGALMKPWIFTEIKEQRHWDISSSERLEMLRRFVHHGLEHWGSDTQGVANVRRFLLEWLSFLYRYIPVGILEHLPQKINEKPPHYHGRDEMETMMASPNCADWVKLTEMLIGRVPEGFTFVPKHKANAYK